LSHAVPETWFAQSCLKQIGRSACLWSPVIAMNLRGFPPGNSATRHSRISGATCSRPLACGPFRAIGSENWNLCRMSIFVFRYLSKMARRTAHCPLVVLPGSLSSPTSSRDSPNVSRDISENSNCKSNTSLISYSRELDQWNSRLKREPFHRKPSPMNVMSPTSKQDVWVEILTPSTPDSGILNRLVQDQIIISLGMIPRISMNARSHACPGKPIGL
jgi:hypothetical protein